MNKRVAVGAVACLLLAAIAGTVASIGARPARAVATSPTLLAEVPASIPPNGAAVDQGGIVVLEPHDMADASTLLTKDDAIRTARHEAGGDNAPQVQATAVLADVTITATIPDAGESGAGWANIQDRSAWVVTFTSPTPFNPCQGMISPQGENIPSLNLMVTRYNTVTDAQTGQFLWGFYTK